MGNSESSNPIRNMDKRTARREYKEDFVRGIEIYKRKLLAEQARREPASQPSDTSYAGNIKVFVRKRPIFNHELAAGEFDVVTCTENSVTVHDARMHSDMKRQLLHHHHFEFNHIFNEHMSNSVVYQKTARPLVDIACRGGFATAMVYGQTGSGKTFTMSSIYAAAAEDIFSTLHSDVERFSKPPSVSVSLIEIAGENVSDLLNAFAPTQLRTAADGAVHAYPVTEPTVSSAEDLLGIIQHGLNIRTTAATGVHDASSRSHAILRIFIRRYDLHASEEAVEGTLTLVDLAGSEHRIDSMYHGKERRKETSQINSSLMALKECIRARATGAIHLHQHVFRKSKLTQALKTSFALPDARTIVIATVSPASKDTEHSLNTLRHACIMHGQEGNRDEKRFLTGGETVVEQIGEVNVASIARRNRAQKKVNGEIENIKASNGNLIDNKAARAANQEVELTEKMKRKLQRQSEAKSFSALPQRVRELLKAHRSNLGDEAYQMARFKVANWSEIRDAVMEAGTVDRDGEDEEVEEEEEEEERVEEDEVRDEVDHFHSSLKEEQDARLSEHCTVLEEKTAPNRRQASPATHPRAISIAHLYDCVFVVEQIVHPMALSIQLEALCRLHGKARSEIEAFFASKGLKLPASPSTFAPTATNPMASVQALAQPVNRPVTPRSSVAQIEGRSSQASAESTGAGSMASRTPSKVVAHIAVHVPGLQTTSNRPSSRSHPRMSEAGGGSGGSGGSTAMEAPLSARSLSTGTSSARPSSAERKRASATVTTRPKSPFLRPSSSTTAATAATPGGPKTAGRESMGPSSSLAAAGMVVTSTSSVAHKGGREGTTSHRSASEAGENEVTHARLQIEREAIQQKARQEAARAFRLEKEERDRQKAEQLKAKTSSSSSRAPPASSSLYASPDPSFAEVPSLEVVAATELAEIQRIQSLLDEDQHVSAEHKLSSAMKYGLKKQVALLKAVVLKKDRLRQGKVPTGGIGPTSGGLDEEADREREEFQDSTPLDNDRIVSSHREKGQLPRRTAPTTAEPEEKEREKDVVDYARLYAEDRWEAPREGDSEEQFSELGRPLSKNTAQKLSQRKQTAKLSYGRSAGMEQEARREERQVAVESMTNGMGQARVQGTVIDYNNEFETVAYVQRASRSGSSSSSRYRMG